MIDYCIKMPENEEYEKGHKYPYYSCEILCSSNGLNIDKLLNTHNESIDSFDKENDNSIDLEKNESNEIKIDNENEKIVNDNVDNNKNNEEQNKIESEENSEKKEINDNINKEKESNEDIENDDKKEEVKMDIEDDECEVDIKSLKEKKKELPNTSLVNSILDHFFSFLNEKSSIENDVLIGYFNKIANYLIKTQTKIILDYLITNHQELITQLISNISRYSIGNLVTNLLNALSENDTPKDNEQYMIIVNKLLEQFNLNENDNNTIEIICDLFIESIIYNNKFKLIKELDENIINKFEIIIQKYFENSSQNKNKILSVINLLGKMNKSILSNFNNKITSNINNDDTKNEMMNLIKSADKVNNQFYSLINNRFDLKELVYKSFLNNYLSYCNSINNICILVINDLIRQSQENNLEEIEISYSSKKIQILGNDKIIKFEFIISVLDLYINLLGVFVDDDEKKIFIFEKIKSLINTNILKLMIEYYFKYKNNNFYSNIMVDLVKIIFDSDKAPEELILSILLLNNQNDLNNDGNFITLLMNDLTKNTKFIFEKTNNSTNSLLFGTNLAILKNIFSSNNPYIQKICERMTKEKFFYDNFIINIDNIFTKKLYKSDSDIDKDKPINVFDSLGLRVGLSNGNQGKCNIAFSVESLNEIIDFYLKVNNKYLLGEDYLPLFKEREDRLEKVKKSSEYKRLSNQDKEDELESEEEEDYDDEDIPKPVFFNSKLDSKKGNEIKDLNNGINNKNENSTEDNKNDINNIEIENQYNDVNFWHSNLKDENMEDILKELL